MTAQVSPVRSRAVTRLVHGWSPTSIQYQASSGYAWTPDDYATLVSLSRARGVDPTVPALLFLEESGLNPHQAGPAGSGVAGLNQTLPGNVGVPTAQWLTMSAAEQMPRIFAWWDKQVQWPVSAGTLLALNFLPGQFANVGAAANPNAVLAGVNGPYASYYGDNSSLDPQHTGVITPATCGLRLQNVAAASSKWRAFKANLPQSNPAPTPFDWGRVALVAVGGVVLGGAAYLVTHAPSRPVRRRRPMRRAYA
jgi:hypothetical protein